MVSTLISDFVLVTYGITILLSLYGFLLFFWWWLKIGKATEVYLYVMFLFGAIVFAIGGAFHGRVYTITGQHEAFHSLVTGPLWKIRIVPVTVVIALIVARMSRRVYLNSKAVSRFRNGGKKNHV